MGSRWVSPIKGEPWDFPGNKIRSHREQPARSSIPNRRSYYDMDDAHLAAWLCRDAYSQGICNLVYFEPDIASVQLDGVRLHLEPGQTVIPHGPDRDLDVPAATVKQT